MAGAARARQRREAKQRYGAASRPAIASLSAFFMIICGFLAFANSYLLIASNIVFGWLIVGFFALFSLIAGIGLFQRADWAYRVGFNFAIIDMMIGFVALIGAFDPRYAVLGWTGIGQAIGVGLLVLGALSLIILSRRQVRHYYLGFV
jgi:hypothetical protein